MELRHLRYFVAVAKYLSFNRAAGDLYISQPALSRQIKNLEDELGVALFIRESNGLTLTQAGHYFLEQAEDILRRSNTAVQIIQARYSSANEALSIGYIPTILQSFLGEALHRFGVAYPQVAVHFQEMPPSQQVVALREGAIDAAFMGNSPSELEEEFEVQCVKRVPIAAMLPSKHRFAHQELIQLIELADENFIGISEETYPKRNVYIRSVCSSAGFTVNLHKFADSHASMIAMVAAGQGVSVLPIELQSLPHSNVVFIPLSPPCYARSTVVRRKEEPSQSLNNFLKILSENSSENSNEELEAS